LWGWAEGPDVTEVEWLACGDPEVMLDQLRETVSDRRWRLCLCAFCRSVWYRVTDPRSRQAVETCQRYADGDASDAELLAARRQGHSAWYETASADPHSPADHAAAGAFMTANEKLIQRLGVAWHFIRAAPDQEREKTAQVAVIRDIFGNPFRPVPSEPSWLTSTVVTLAAGIYEEKAFDRMPILADALQDAGCENSEVLEHCREVDQIHVRGCWVIDLLLGKE
jgi:hypothetical protein